MEEGQVTKLTLTNVEELKGYIVDVSIVEDEGKHILRIDIPFATQASAREAEGELEKANTLF